MKLPTKPTRLFEAIPGAPLKVGDAVADPVMVIEGEVVELKPEAEPEPDSIPDPIPEDIVGVVIPDMEVALVMLPPMLAIVVATYARQSQKYFAREGEFNAY